MKMKFTLSVLFLIFASFVHLSCSEKGNNSPNEPTTKVFDIDKTEANFPRFTIKPNLNISSIQWIFPDNQIIKGKTSTSHYFAEKGDYEITLQYLLDGKKQEQTETISITQNSKHFDQGEALWWNDEFDGASIDLSNWNYDIGSNKDENRWGNNEWQNYTNSPDNSFMRDGKLVIKAMLDGEGQRVEGYTSARLTTKGKKEINRGRVEVKAKLGGGVGLWPAIWLYQSSWLDGHYSELDIMEYVGVDKNIIYSAAHTNKTKEKPENSVAENKRIVGVEDDFHIYGANWTDGKVEFYIDNPDTPHLIFKIDNMNDPNEWPFDKKLYLILNIAVGGDWGGMKGVDDNIFPQEMEVEYVRIFQKQN